MIIRLNGVIKLANSLVNKFFLLSNRFKEFHKSGMSLARSVICHNISFTEFKNFITNAFFMIQKGGNLPQNIITVSTAQTPNHLISTVAMFRSVKKIKVTAKAFCNPFKKWDLRIVALNLSDIRILSASWLFSFQNVKRTFSINKTSKISKIFDSWYNSLFCLIKNRFHRSSNQICFKLQNFHFIIKMFFVFSKKDVSKFSHQNRFFLFFNKISFNFWKNLKAFNIKSKCKNFVLAFTSWQSIGKGSFKISFEPFSIFFVNSGYRQGVGKFCAYAKTSVPVYITGCVSVCSIFHMPAVYSKESFRSTSNRMYEFMEGIGGEDKFGTSPVRDAYIAMGSTMLQGQFEAIPQFTYKWNYPSVTSTMPSEYGSVANVRFLLSSIGAVIPNASANGADVYPLIVAGRESYCIVEQDRYSAQFIYRPPIFSSPLALNATVGYKMAWAGVITNDAWVFLLNSTLSV